MDGTVFIGSEVYRARVSMPPHPLAVVRSPYAEDLARAMGWLGDAQYRAAPEASAAEIGRYHDADYIEALMSTRIASGFLPETEAQARYRIGLDGNPMHPSIWRRSAVSAGGALLAAELTRAGGVVHVPGSGNHHAMRARASGFCYVNDPALGLFAWLDQGLERLVYVDLDAHHGDGVEAAFADDPRVLTISVHEAGRWPHTGVVSDPGRGVLNFPVPAGLNDVEMDFLMQEAILPAVAAHRPLGILVVPGSDALADDPMSKLRLSNFGLWRAVGALRGLAPRFVVQGGGGYNPFGLARAWAGIWALLNGIAVPEVLPQAALDVLAQIRYFRVDGRATPARWLSSIADRPRIGSVRAEVRALAAS